MEEPVADCISERGVGQIFVPLVRRQLAGDDGGARGGAVFEDLEQIPPVLIAERPESPIVEDEDVDACEAGEETDVTAVGVREREFFAEPRDAPIERAVALPTRLLGEGTGEIGLAGAGCARDAGFGDRERSDRFIVDTQIGPS